MVGIKKMVLAFVILAVLVGNAMAIERTQPGDFTGASWMSWEKTARIVYVMGFLAGMVEVTKGIGVGEILQRGAYSYVDMERMVYQNLVKHPKLQDDPISKIIIHTLYPVLSLKKTAPQSPPVAEKPKVGDI